MLNTGKYYRRTARKNQEKRPDVQQILHNFRYTSHNFQNNFSILLYARKKTAAQENGTAQKRDAAKNRKPPAQKRPKPESRPRGWKARKPQTGNKKSESRPRQTARAATFFLIGFCIQSAFIPQRWRAAVS